MNFVQQLEECLRDLAAEARKKHPGVKEASERATLKLRILQNSYVAAVRLASSTNSVSNIDGGGGSRSSNTIVNSSNVRETIANMSSAAKAQQQQQQHPTTSMFRSSEILHPFLLAANYPNADFKLLEISFRAMRLLMEADAIVPTDGIHMLRVYQIQAQVITAYYSKYYAREIAAQQQIQQQQQQQAEALAAAAAVAATAAATGDYSSYDHNSPQSPSSLKTSGENHHLQHEDLVSYETSEFGYSSNATTNNNTGFSWFTWGMSSSHSSTNRESYATTSKDLRQRAGSNESGHDESSTATTVSTSSSTTAKAMTTLKNAVSSSSGQSGHQASMSSYPQMEKLALEILSSLLQLVQVLRNYPLSLTDEIWTNSVSLACLWCSLLPPHVYTSRTTSTLQSNTVQQAAHSTVHQLISLLYETNTQQTHENSRDHQHNVSKSLEVFGGKFINHKFIQQTWDDLLLLTASNQAQRGGGSTILKLSGAFQLCQRRTKSTSSHRVTTNSGSVALPPSPELSLELMTQVCKDTAFMIRNSQHDSSKGSYEELLLRTMGVTMALLQQIARPQTTVEKSLRIIQWTLALLQTHSRQYPNECRELLMFMVNKQIPITTTACRKHHDFEDGYVYTADDAVQIKNECRMHSNAPNSGIFNDNSMLSSSSSSSSSKEIHAKRKTASTADCQLLLSCFPSHHLWKASFVLELTYHLLNKENFDILVDDELALLFRMDEPEIERTNGRYKPTLQAITEALSDFATVGSSCHDHIIQVVQFCYTRRNSRFKPTLFRTAEQIVASGNSLSYFANDSFDGMSDTNSIDVPTLKRSLMKRSASYTASVTCPVLGESIWTALQIILRIVQCLECNIHSLPDPKRLLNEIFPSSLAVFQHFMKRFVACDELVRLNLQGYSMLAGICLKMIANNYNDPDTTVRRHILLSSLSKLSLPSWGKHDPSSQLLDHHVLSLLCLIRIIHLHYDEIGTEWEILLKTMEDLSMLSIASRYLSEEVYHSSLALAALFTRFAGLSTCLSSQSLTHMVTVLTSICETVLQDRDIVGDTDTVLPERSQHMMLSDSSDRGLSNVDGRESTTIGGKIISIGVRAIYGNTSSGSGDDQEIQTESAKAERTKNVYYQDYRDDFIRRVSVSNTPVRMNSFGRIPFCLMLLCDVTTLNAFRHNEFGDLFTSLFFRLSATRPIVRPFVMDIMTMHIMTLLTGDVKSQFLQPGRIVFEDPMYSQLLAVERDTNVPPINEGVPFSQIHILKPLCETITITKKSAVAQSALGVLDSVLEGTGENLHGDVWPLVIDSITSLSGGSTLYADRSSSEWSTCCLVAFKSLKLIVDDFLDSLKKSTTSNVRTHISLLECCASFVLSRHDINTSLTAIGLLWTIADKDSEASSVDRALSKLVDLSSDDRTEVRNAAVNTLFSCIAGRGHSFTPSFWKTCITDTILKVYTIVTEKSRSGIAGQSINATTSRYKVAYHHSRDSTGKQWVVTQVLVLRGLTRVLRNFFAQLLDSVALDQESDDPNLWFQDAWVKILDYAFDAAGQPGGRENLDIRSIGVELLVVCCQLASKSGIHAAISPAKVSTRMEVINGALRNVRETQSIKTTWERSYTSAAESWRQNLFMEAFESLEFFDEDILRKWENPDDVDLQVLHKHCSNLAKLYDCCRDNEFKTDNRTRSLRLLESTEKDYEEELRQDLEGRFVLLVASILTVASPDSKLRFINQCQRCAIDLLQMMAAAGSAAAFNHLISLAGIAFFTRRDNDEANASSSEHDTTDLPDLISFETSAAVSHEIQNVTVTGECKLFVLDRVMQIFLVEFGQLQQHRKRRYYKSLIPIIEHGLKAATSTENLFYDAASASTIIDLIWKKFFACLEDMLMPVAVLKDIKKIPRVPEVLTVISCAVQSLQISTQRSYRSKLSSILSHGSSCALNIAKQHAIRSSHESTSSSDIARKSKRHRDDLLKLFDVCFLGSCALNPDDPGLRTSAATALNGTTTRINALSSDEDAATTKVSVDASLLVCKTLLETKVGVEGIVFSIFSSLCILVSTPSGTDKDDLARSELKKYVHKLFVELNVDNILDRARERYETAEKKAKDAMGQVAGLESAIQELQYEKEMLQREVARLNGTSPAP